MKFECQINKLKRAVSIVERATSKNPTLPVLSSILLTAKKNKLKLIATNLDIGVEVDIPVKIKKEGTTAISGAIVNNVLTTFIDSEVVNVDMVGNNLSITTPNNTTITKTLPIDDFPNIPKVAPEKDMKINSVDMVDGFRSVLYSTSVSDIKPEIASVLIYSENNQVVFVATDSFRLAEKKIDTKGVDDFPQTLIPTKNVSEIIRVFDGVEEDVLVKVSKNQISFESDGVYVVSRITDGVFPNYRQIMTNTFKTEVVVLKDDLVNSLRLANVFAGKLNKANIKTIIEDGVLEINAESSDIGESTARIDATLTGEDVNISLNQRYILDCFQTIHEDSVSIGFNTNAKPTVIKGVGNKSFTYLVMPMNR